jgi:hypothetical protein
MTKRGPVIRAGVKNQPPLANTTVTFSALYTATNIANYQSTSTLVERTATVDLLAAPASNQLQFEELPDYLKPGDTFTLAGITWPVLNFNANTNIVTTNSWNGVINPTSYFQTGVTFTIGNPPEYYSAAQWLNNNYNTTGTWKVFNDNIPSWVTPSGVVVGNDPMYIPGDRWRVTIGWFSINTGFQGAFEYTWADDPLTHYKFSSLPQNLTLASTPGTNGLNGPYFVWNPNSSATNKGIKHYIYAINYSDNSVVAWPGDNNGAIPRNTNEAGKYPNDSLDKINYQPIIQPENIGEWAFFYNASDQFLGTLTSQVSLGKSVSTQWQSSGTVFTTSYVSTSSISGSAKREFVVAEIPTNLKVGDYLQYAGVTWPVLWIDRNRSAVGTFFWYGLFDPFAFRNTPFIFNLGGDPQFAREQFQTLDVNPSNNYVTLPAGNYQISAELNFGGSFEDLIRVPVGSSTEPFNLQVSQPIEPLFSATAEDVGNFIEFKAKLYKPISDNVEFLRSTTLRLFDGATEVATTSTWTYSTNAAEAVFLVSDSNYSTLTNYTARFSGNVNNLRWNSNWPKYTSSTFDFTFINNINYFSTMTLSTSGLLGYGQIANVQAIVTGKSTDPLSIPQGMVRFVAPQRDPLTNQLYQTTATLVNGAASVAIDSKYLVPGPVTQWTNAVVTATYMSTNLYPTTTASVTISVSPNTPFNYGPSSTGVSYYMGFFNFSYTKNETSTQVGPSTYFYTVPQLYQYAGKITWYFNPTALNTSTTNAITNEFRPMTNSTGTWVFQNTYWAVSGPSLGLNGVTLAESNLNITSTVYTPYGIETNFVYSFRVNGLTNKVYKVRPFLLVTRIPNNILQEFTNVFAYRVDITGYAIDGQAVGTDKMSFSYT